MSRSSPSPFVGILLLALPGAGLAALIAVLLHLRGAQLDGRSRALEQEALGIARYQSVLERWNPGPEAGAPAVGNLTLGAQPEGEPDAVSEWSRLPPEARERVQANYRRWEQLPEAMRERLRERYRRFVRLPPETRRQLLQQSP